MDALKNPLTHAELVELFEASEDGFIQVDVLVDFEAVLGTDLEGFLDLLCDLVGSSYLMDIGYQVSGYKGGDDLVVTVTADATMAVEQGA